jgi:hypothetical protein
MSEISPKAHDATEITINQLVGKRADILFEISEAEKRIERLRAELVHLDIVLRMFRPELAVETLPIRYRRPTKSPYFGHGELTQRIYDALRQHGTISSVDVALAAMVEKGLDPDNDLRTRYDFIKRIARMLSDMHKRGKIERFGRGKSIQWRLTI